MALVLVAASANRRVRVALVTEWPGLEVAASGPDLPTRSGGAGIGRGGER